MSLPYFSPKDPLETIVLSVSFVALLAAGETISSATWLAELLDGTAVEATDLLSGVCDISTAGIVRQTVVGGVHLVTYLHRARAVTSTGRVLVGGGLQRVVKGA